MNNGKPTTSMSATSHSPSVERKPYQRPTLRRLGDFHTMTRTAYVLFQYQDQIINDFYIS